VPADAHATAAAANVGRDQDLVAGGKARGNIAPSRDLPGNLVAGDALNAARVGAMLPAPDAQVRTADAGAGHAHQDVALLQRRQRATLHPYIARAVVDCGPHAIRLHGSAPEACITSVRKTGRSC